MAEPCRGDVWLVRLAPAQGHEQSGTRPGLVLSVDAFNHGPADLVVIVPITTKAKGIPFHVEVPAREGGLGRRSYVKSEDVRSISRERLVKRLGAVPMESMSQVEDRMRILLGL